MQQKMFMIVAVWKNVQRVYKQLQCQCKVGKFFRQGLMHF